MYKGVRAEERKESVQKGGDECDLVTSASVQWTIVWSDPVIL